MSRLPRDGRVEPRRNVLTMMIHFGEGLSWLQRVAYALASLATLATGLVILQGAAQFIRDKFLEAASLGLFGIPLTIVGALGVRNVLRFRK
jgi:hypothetical protein